MGRAKYGTDNPACKHDDKTVAEALAYKERHPEAGAKRITYWLESRGKKVSHHTVTKWIYQLNRYNVRK